jgi:hypothetical protein
MDVESLDAAKKVSTRTAIRPFHVNDANFEGFTFPILDRVLVSSKPSTPSIWSVARTRRCWDGDEQVDLGVINN